MILLNNGQKNIQVHIINNYIYISSLCSGFQADVHRIFHYVPGPPLSVFDVPSINIDISLIVNIQLRSSTHKHAAFDIIYNSDHYFTCRFLSKAGECWKYDGLLFGGQPIPKDIPANVINLFAIDGSYCICAV